MLVTVWYNSLTNEYAEASEDAVAPDDTWKNVSDNIAHLQKFLTRKGRGMTNTNEWTSAPVAPGIEIFPIENVETPTVSIEIPAKTPRKRRSKAEIEAEAATPKTVKPEKETNPFIDILRFIALASNAKGADHESHCRVENGWIVSTDGLISCGHPINLGANFNPKTENLKKLLTQFSKDFSIVSGSESSATFTCGDFTSVIPCVTGGEINEVTPDHYWGPVNQTLLDGFKAVETVLISKAAFVSHNCIRLDSNLVTGFNGTSVLQYWHGWTVPLGVSIPKQAVKAVLKAGKELVGIGYGLESVTFYFRDGAWIKTQVYQEAYPDLDTCFNQPMNYGVVPTELFSKLKFLRSIAESDSIFIRDGAVSDYPNDEKGSKFSFKELEGLDTIFSYRELNLGDSELFNQVSITNDCCSFVGTHGRLFISRTSINQVDL